VSAEPTIRWNISDPFNFQHMTHTEPVQFQKMQQAPHDNLVSEFSAMRASQSPQRQLRGIRADDLPGNNSDHESYSPKTSARHSTGGTFSPSHDQRAQDPGDDVAFSSVHKLSYSENLDSFSQMSPLFLAESFEHSNPTSPPLRVSSRHFAPDSLTHHHESPTDTSFEHRSNGEALIEVEYEAEYDGSFDYPIATWNDGVYDFTVPHAVTTPDDAAHILRPPPFQMMKTELEQVLEEDECSEGGKRSSINTLVTRPTTPNLALRHTKSFPSALSSIQSSPETKPPLPIMERGSPNRKRRVSSQVLPFFERDYDDLPTRPRFSRHPSVKNNEAEANWEDLVDWCYDQSAEADCNFDFTRASMPMEKTILSIYNAPVTGTMHPAPPLPIPDATAQVDDRPTSKRPTSSIYSSQRPVSSAYSSVPPSPIHGQANVPDLEPSSAVSAQSSFNSGSEAATPCLDSTSDLRSSYPLIDSKQSDLSEFTGSTPLVVPNEVSPHDGDEDLYQEQFARDSVPNAPFPYHIGQIDGSTVGSISARSSRSPISKCSSQENFWARHRASNSAGSLPDLVLSKSRSDKVDPVVEQLADQTTALNATELSTDSPQAIGYHRRSSTLAKDVAVKSMLSRVMSYHALEDQDVPLPTHPAFRDRAGTEAAFLESEPCVPPPPSRPTQRLRSASSASSLKSVSRPMSRASYGLFPKIGIRASVIESSGVRTSTIEPTFPGRAS